MMIRPVRTDDYRIISEINKAAFPDTVTTQSAEMIRYWDNALREKYKCARFVVIKDQRIVAVAHRQNMVTINHPDKFYLTLAVLPEYQRQGIGATLYDHILDDLPSDNVLSLRMRCREDMHNSVRFLIGRGFREEEREWESRLELNQFDESPFAKVVTNVRNQGIVITSLHELRNQPGWQRKLYELVISIESDMPFHDVYTPFTFEEFANVVMKLPNIYPDAYFVALDGVRYVGLNILEHDPDVSDQLSTDDTGVIKSYRRRGIALALKITGIRFAREHGYARIRTFNDLSNLAIISINDRLGFEKYPAWIGFIKKFS